MDGQVFRTKAGKELHGISTEQTRKMWQELFGTYGMLPSQITEAASYSMAMVVRFALGLSAQGGKVFVLVDDSICGWIAAATLRHLTNAGADGAILLDCDPDKASKDLELQAAPLQARNMPIATLAEFLTDPRAQEMIDGCHNIICGIFNPDKQLSPEMQRLIPILNESATPVHCIGAPLGVDVETGTPGEVPLYASSTLSLGAPFQGLYAGDEFVGRHYLCDISCPPELYTALGEDLSQLFSDQPVVQILVPKVEEEEGSEKK